MLSHLTQTRYVEWKFTRLISTQIYDKWFRETPSNLVRSHRILARSPSSPPQRHHQRPILSNQPQPTLAWPADPTIWLLDCISSTPTQSGWIMDYPNRPVDTPNNISLATTILGFLSLIPKIQSIIKKTFYWLLA